MITVTMGVDLYLDSISTLDDFRSTWRQSKAVADPGFSRGGGVNPPGGA